MAEESEGPETATEASAAGVDPAAIALALSGASREDARDFLKKQGALIDDQQNLVRLQAQELSHELGLRHWSLWVRHASGVLKLVLELSAGLLLLALVAGVGLMVSNAAHSDGLVIESFSVPPDLAAKGITGQMIASKTLDRLTTMVSANHSARAAKTFANNWDDDIKVEIPDTGVSIGEAYRFLKSRLGHETHITGEVYRTQEGIAITARAGSSGGATVTGSEADLDALVDKTAENIFSATQPYRYGIYLDAHGRIAESIPVFKALATTGPLQERPWGYIGWSNALMDTAQSSVRADLLKQAVALQPDNILALGNLAIEESYSGQEEAASRTHAVLKSVLSSHGAGLIDAARLPGLRDNAEASRAALAGSYQDAALAIAQSEAAGNVNVTSASYVLAEYEVGAHDLGAARAAIADPVPSTGLAPRAEAYAALVARIQIKSEANDWAGALSDARDLDVLQRKYSGIHDPVLAKDLPLIAYARARLGDFSAAERAIAATPGDCGPCLLARGRIADLQGQHARADWWFARAVAAGPSIPFANAEWGQALLERGQPDAAMQKLKLANQKGPRFADPLEMWGEALMAQNRSDLALTKFVEANKYAPNWGRLHLKWGEALGYAGKPQDAKAEFARAATFDLTPSEKAELENGIHG